MRLTAKWRTMMTEEEAQELKKLRRKMDASKREYQELENKLKNRCIQRLRRG